IIVERSLSSCKLTYQPNGQLALGLGTTTTTTTNNQQPTTTNNQQPTTNTPEPTLVSWPRFITVV
ncbi:MAG: hypothetical protein N6V41_01400, partial [Candidatus Portiera aleyrodidarum]|nr:hypothetical protein [Candidatus Portiera aleyrodidarum]